jgi:magnesium transporter
MPNLRRIPRTVRRRPRVSQRQDVARTEPHVAELELGGVRWLNIEAPTAVETAYLAEHFDFHQLDLEDVLSTRQRPKIDEYDEYLFMVLHLPRFDKSIGRLNAAELNVFVGPDYVITLPNQPLKPVRRLFTRL